MYRQQQLQLREQTESTEENDSSRHATDLYSHSPRFQQPTTADNGYDKDTARDFPRLQQVNSGTAPSIRPGLIFFHILPPVLVLVTSHAGGATDHEIPIEL